MNFTKKLVAYFSYPKEKQKGSFMLLEDIRIMSSILNYYSKNLSFVSHKCCYYSTVTTHPVSK